MTETLLEAVTRHTAAHAGSNVLTTAIEGLSFLRSPQERQPSYRIHKPALCIVVQGTKWAIFGDRRIEYGAGQALVVSIEMPILGRIAAATPDKPYLGIVLEFDTGILREVIETLDPPPLSTGKVGSGVFVTNFDGALTDCIQRMIRLLDTPRAIPTLYPLTMREICYWLLTGPHGGEVASVTLLNSHTRSVIHAIHLLRDQYTESVRIEELAARVQMSPSAFHRQFKSITSLTPLQYQKQLRLLEARRLMLTDATSAEIAAFQVGYESASQFSREYTRMFGAPPRRDIVRMQTVVTHPHDKEL